MVPNFYKTRLIYQATNLIADHRQELIKELVAYSGDPVRYQRRCRMLTQLADYEHQLLQKITRFETDDTRDLDIGEIAVEVSTITQRDA